MPNDVEPHAIVYAENWCFFEGRKYWEADVESLAEKHLQRIEDGALSGQSLMSVVMRYLRRAENQELGVPMEAEDYALIQHASSTLPIFA